MFVPPLIYRSSQLMSAILSIGSHFTGVIYLCVALLKCKRHRVTWFGSRPFYQWCGCSTIILLIVFMRHSVTWCDFRFFVVCLGISAHSAHPTSRGATDRCELRKFATSSRTKRFFHSEDRQLPVDCNS